MRSSRNQRSAHCRRANQGAAQVSVTVFISCRNRTGVERIRGEDMAEIKAATRGQDVWMTCTTPRDTSRVHASSRCVCHDDGAARLGTCHRHVIQRTARPHGQTARKAVKCHSRCNGSPARGFYLEVGSSLEEYQSSNIRRLIDVMIVPSLSALLLRGSVLTTRNITP